MGELPLRIHARCYNSRLSQAVGIFHVLPQPRDKECGVWVWVWRKRGVTKCWRLPPHQGQVALLLLVAQSDLLGIGWAAGT